MQTEEENLPQAWGILLQLLRALPNCPLKKNEILDIFYNVLTDASWDFLDSCASCVFRERTIDQAEELLNNILQNADNWTLPEPPPEPISQCTNEFNNYIVKQEHLNNYVKDQLRHNAMMIDRLSDLMFRIANDVKGLGKHASMVHTQLDQVTKSHNDLLTKINNNMHDHAVRVMTRGGRMTQEPLFPKGHPKRIEQDSQRINEDAPSPTKKKK